MTCKEVLDKNDLTVAEFYAWNPAVGPECGNMWPNYRYCIRGPEATSTGTGPSVPGPTQSGIPENCEKWHVTKENDTCPKVVKEYGITLEQFYRNTAVQNDCADGFWKGNAYCVAVSG
ncbi:hypothetical protein FE257_001067 [Aspergillus nanangensis]|uniref:LysM domain-containing protein n=1 Tax=Aspergillus nanangensis TaxID=2582783 RepID=A0AAD4CTY7_ASPNN|nr:hypothetical protein FE257_001067 [Aspergillus nanangensis]